MRDRALKKPPQLPVKDRQCWVQGPNTKPQGQRGVFTRPLSCSGGGLTLSHLPPDPVLHHTRASSWCVTATGFVPAPKVGPRTQVTDLRRSGYGAGGLWQRVEVSGQVGQLEQVLSLVG